ncbi:hypothetical protein [Billgrantia antri]|uniref:Uncharacterized protein n=1 Tax=Billgrantia antri TaxID=2846777 RepID=A0ABS6ZQX4_9GAMM|nr:hypothetical protein [Halomonas antri]MBW6391324.1 hypothetical protein [Halomonas antri]
MNFDSSIYDGFGVTQEDVDAYVYLDIGLYGVDITRISSYLLVQLASAWKHRTLNTYSITDVIQSLEGVRQRARPPKAKPFKGVALSGLWKVHFVNPRFFVRNVYNEWGMFHENTQKFVALCARVAEAERQEPLPLGWQGQLAHEYVIGGYENRARKGKLTGEWLIFGIHEGKNIYLTLCQHSSGPEEDEEIQQALRGLCGSEFPELFSAIAQQGA